MIGIGFGVYCTILITRKSIGSHLAPELCLAVRCSPCLLGVVVIAVRLRGFQIWSASGLGFFELGSSLGFGGVGILGFGVFRAGSFQLHSAGRKDFGARGWVLGFMDCWIGLGAEAQGSWRTCQEPQTQTIPVFPYHQRPSTGLPRSTLELWQLIFNPLSKRLYLLQFLSTATPSHQNPYERHSS